MKLAIIFPAYNEEQTIKEVVESFYNKYPHAYFYVIDNNSCDKTNEIAKETFKKLNCKGAILTESAQGKGNALRRAFLEINADIYVTVDADLTYSVSDLPELLEAIENNQYDMIMCTKKSFSFYLIINMFGNTPSN